MFQLKNPTEPTDLQKAIDRVHIALSGYEPDSEEYAKVSDQLVKLEKLKDETTSKRRPSPDAIVAACASIVSVLLIVGYEHAHVFTSKAASFVPKALR